MLISSISSKIIKDIVRIDSFPMQGLAHSPLSTRRLLILSKSGLWHAAAVPSEVATAYVLSMLIQHVPTAQTLLSCYISQSHKASLLCMISLFSYSPLSRQPSSTPTMHAKCSCQMLAYRSQALIGKSYHSTKKKTPRYASPFTRLLTMLA